MKIFFLYVLAFLGGVSLAVQAGFNTQLGSLLKQPVLAVIPTSVISAILGCFFILALGKQTIQLDAVQQVPWYLWLVGGLFSMIGISLYFYTIPKLGVSKMITLGLSGQMVFALIAGKYGWLNLPIEPIATKQLLGLLAMITGIILINSK